MTTEITVTAKNIEDWRQRGDNAHLVSYGNRVRVVSAEYHSTVRTGRLIVTMDDMAAIDPKADSYSAEFLAAMLTDYANNLES